MQHVYGITLETSLEVCKFNGINTRHKMELYRPSTKCAMYQRGVYCSNIKIYTIYTDLLLTCIVFKKAHPTRIRIFNNLPQNITSLRNEKPQFKVALKKFFISTLLLLCG